MDPSSRDMGTLGDLSGDRDPNTCPDYDQSIPFTQQQPQVKFGDYSPDAGLLPLSVGQPPVFASDDSWAYGGFDIGDEQGDAKRRRIARACDACRKKKIRCDAKMPKCSHCENYKTECIFTHIEKKRAQPKGAKYIEGLENRLGRMEHLLRLSGLLSEDDEEGADLGTLEQRLAQQVNSNRESPRSITSGPEQPTSTSQRGDGRRTSPQRSGMHSPTSNRSSPKLQHGDQKVKSEEREHAKVKDKDVDDLADMMWCSLVTNSQGETRFIGSSSGFSIFSPKGVQWVSEKTGDDSFVNMITALSQDDNKWYPWREEVFGDIFARRVFKPLPPREECESLIEEFFESFNTMFPLFHEPTFRHLVDMQYSEDPYDGSGWWASLNVALAIAYRIRRLKVQPPGGEESVSWAYFKNALGVLSELTMRNTDLLSVQALIGMCLFLQGSPNPQPSFYLIGAAFRLAHSIGLHKHGSGFGLNEAEVEQRKRVFWIAYMIDKDISLRSGRPPAQDDDDWNVELPSENPKDGFGTVPVADGTKTNLFHTLCRFAVISAKVYNKLYSVKAARQSDGELLSTIGDLDAELEAWKDSIPLDFRPEHELTALPTHLVIHIVILHFAYYNCLTTIHRRSVHHGYWTSRLSDYAVSGLNVKPLNPRVFSSAALCVSAARTSIHLIKYIPRNDYAFVWLILYYPVSSLVTVFANILQNPQDARARSDLKLVGVVVDFLQKITLEDPSGSMQRMHAVCRNFQRIAGLVLDKAEQDMTTRHKRKQEREREKIAKRPHEPVELPQPIRRSTEMQNAADSFRVTSQAFAKQQQQPHIQFSPPRQNNDGSGTGRTFTQMSSANLDNGTTPAHDFNQAGHAQGTSDHSLPMAELLYRATEMPTSWPLYTEQRPSNLHQPFASVSPQPTLPNQPQDQSNLTSTFSDDFLATMNAANMTNSTEASSPDFTTPTFSNFGFGTTVGPNSFQQPMVPQELWNMPMTFEWDWADMMNASMTQGLGQGPGGFDQIGADEVNTTMGGNAAREDEQDRQGHGRYL